jgi:glycosyltransferase involved in cell wall biosynthesis
VVVPVYDNAGTLVELAARVRQVCSGAAIAHELLLIVDGSPDDAADVARAVAHDDVAVGWLQLARNCGQHRAVRVGLAHATAPWIACMDADLQDPPEALPRLMETAREGWDAVYAGRRGCYQSWTRMVTSRLFKTTLSLVSGLPADAGMYHLMSQRMAERLLDFPHDIPFQIALMGLTGLPQTSVPVVRDLRAIGSSAYTGGARFWTGMTAIAFAMRYRLDRRGTGRPLPQLEIAGRGGACAMTYADRPWIVG